MAGLVGGTPASFNGATWVAAVAAPASGKQRQVLACHVENLDTVTHTFKSRKKVGVTGYEVYQELILDAGRKGQLVVGSIVLDATDTAGKRCASRGVGGRFYGGMPAPRGAGRSRNSGPLKTPLSGRTNGPGPASILGEVRPGEIKAGPSEIKGQRQ